MIRRKLSAAEHVNLFLTHKGICHCCGGRIVNKPWDVEHVIPLAMGGPDEISNMRPAHRNCHAEKTHETDIPNIAKAKRRQQRHWGIKKERTIVAWRNFKDEIVRAPKRR